MPARLTVDRETIGRFCREHRIRRLSLFGSVLRDDFGPDSDVDVLVEFEPGTPMGLMGLTRVEMALSDLLGRKVDLNTPRGLHQRFRDKVLAEAEVLYAA